MRRASSRQHWAVAFCGDAVAAAWFFARQVPAIAAGTLAVLALVAGLLAAVG